MASVMTLDGKAALLVEDELFVAEKISQQLRELGFREVFTAASIKEAMEHIEDERIDLALLDVNLPDNETTIGLGCALSGECVPVVFFSALTEGEMARLSQGQEFLEKPVSVPRLERAIHRAIERAPDLARQMADKKMAGQMARQ